MRTPNIRWSALPAWLLTFFLTVLPAKRRYLPMIYKSALTVVFSLIVLGLIAPVTVWGSSIGHHPVQGHSSYRGYYGHYSHYGPYSYYGYSYHSYAHSHGYDDQSYEGIGSSEVQGAFDLNVKPKGTQVYVDGRYVGVTDNFDGFPRYLWLKKGTYEVVFYNDGYETVVRELAIYPGVVIDVRERLLPGKSVSPKELISKPAPGDEPAEEGEGEAS